MMKNSFWKNLLWSVLDVVLGLFTDHFRKKKDELKNGNPTL